MRYLILALALLLIGGCSDGDLGLVPTGSPGRDEHNVAPGPPVGVVGALDATPTPTPTPGPKVVAPTPLPLLVEGDVVSIIHEVFGVNAGPALAVAWCESRFDPSITGAAGERGLFQIHPVHWGWLDEDRLFDPLYNAQMAYELSQGGTDWSSWTCQP